MKEPFKALVQELITRMRKHEPSLQMEAKDAIFRINRDIRFAKDKSPYKTHCAAHISVHGKKVIRTLLVKKGKDFEKIIKSKKFFELYGELKGERNKVVPAEFRKASEKNPLIANKQFFWGVDLSKKDVQDSKLVDNLVTYYLAGKPAQDFLNQLY